MMDLAALLPWPAVEARVFGERLFFYSGLASPRCSKWCGAAFSPSGRAASMVEVVSVVVYKCATQGALGAFLQRFAAACSVSLAGPKGSRATAP
jgi:hypothetical protein